MELFQLVGSFAAIALLALLALWLYPRAGTLDDARARRNFNRHYPDCRIDRLVLTDDGSAALVMLQGTATLGLAVLLGDRVVCRLIEAGTLAGVDATPTGLKLRFQDFTLPSHFLALSGDSFKIADNALKNIMQKAVPHAA